MAYVLSLSLATILSGSFVALTFFEKRRGTRYFERERAALDRAVEQLLFILANVQLSAWAQDEMRRAAGRISHGVVHFSLQITRAIERSLTRIIKYLRSKQEAQEAPKASERAFIGTLADFKSQLSSTRPHVSEAEEIR